MHKRLLLFLVVAMGVAASPARAGTYTVYSCRTPGGVMAPTDGWIAEPYGGTDLTYVTADNCGVGTSPGNLSVRSTSWHPGEGADPSFTWRAGWQGVLRYPAAPDTSFSKVTLWRSSFVTQNRTASATNYWAAWLGAGSPERADAIDGCGYDSTTPNASAEGPTCSKGTGVSDHDVEAVNRTEIDSLKDVHDLYLVSACVGNPGQYCNPNGAYDLEDGTTRQGGYARYEVQALAAEVTDAIPPMVTDVSGALATATTIAGTSTLAFSATDRGAGLYHTSVEYRSVGGAQWKTASRSLVDANGGRCAELDYLPDDDHEFGFRQPCVLTASPSVSFDSTGVKDGTYDLRVVVEDAAGNVTPVADARRVAIDNVPAPGATALPAIIGAPKLSALVHGDVGSWTGEDDVYTRSWLRCNDADLDSCQPIVGADGDSYRLVAADMGRVLRLRVAATNAEGTSSAVSDPAGPGVNAGGHVPQCADGLDNDNDGKVDEADPECVNRADDDESKGGAQGVATPSSGSSATVPSPTSSADGAASLTIDGASRRTLAFGRASAVTLTLRDGRGKAVDGGQIGVSQRAAVLGANYSAVSVPLTTAADGTVRYVIAAGPSRTLRFTAAGASAELQIRVASKTTLRLSRMFLRNGQTLRFRGRVLSRPLPRTGVGVDLQARVGHRWQTFRSMTTDRHGRWHSSYRFRSTVGLQTYTFRARVRGDSGYPYLPSTSKQAKVRVRG